MPIEDVFSISGRGTVVTGRVERGVININDQVEIIGLRETRKSVATGLEMFNKLLSKAEAGEIPQFTGINSVYEAPKKPDLHIKPLKQTMNEIVDLLVNKTKNWR